MPASAHEVAAEIRRRLPGVPVMKLHKLLYYCQGHHLAHFGTALFEDAVVAFDNGPVVVNLWQDEKYGAIMEPPSGHRFTEGELNTIGYVCSRYGRMTGRELAIQTHGETPWQKANEGRQPGTSKRIDQNSIREYFEDADRADREEDPLMVDSDALQEMLAGASGRARQVGRPDDINALIARRNELAKKLGRG